MRQRRLEERVETSAARVTRGTYHEPVPLSIRILHPNRPTVRVSLAGRPSHPGLVRRGAIDRGHFAVRHAQVDRELPAVVHHVHQEEPEKVEPSHVAHLFWGRRRTSPSCSGLRRWPSVRCRPSSGTRARTRTLRRPTAWAARVVSGGTRASP